ncbi:Asp23/Gls24 family envelope stress response protein [Candidatus Bipolaricaulota bacterium]|nr:Asp23/Gls24 family envelope stress response protein [Candidatus Bipolaricaulota bacterium]
MPKEVEYVEGGPEEGKISISKDVIATIAGLAATEVEGIAPPKGGALPKGEAVRKLVETELTEGRVKIGLKVGVVYGYVVHEVARDLQERVKAEVEKMTALPVDMVDVEVVRVVFPEGGKPGERRG